MIAIDHRKAPEAHNEEMALFDDFLMNMEAFAKMRGFSMAELSRRSKVSESHISLMRRRQRDATIGTVEKLARALKVEGKDLLSGVTPGADEAAADHIRALFLSASHDDQLALLQLAERCARDSEETP